jgi:flagellar protein FlbD
MITLHRLGHAAEEFLLNPDLILTVEATPDTVVTLTNGHKIVVVESPWRVAQEIRRWRAGVLADALGGARPLAQPVEVAVGAADHQSR